MKNPPNKFFCSKNVFNLIRQNPVNNISIEPHLSIFLINTKL